MGRMGGWVGGRRVQPKPTSVYIECRVACSLISLTRGTVWLRVWGCDGSGRRTSEGVCKEGTPEVVGGHHSSPLVTTHHHSSLQPQQLPVSNIKYLPLSHAHTSSLVHTFASLCHMRHMRPMCVPGAATLCRPASLAPPLLLPFSSPSPPLHPFAPSHPLCCAVLCACCVQIPAGCDRGGSKDVEDIVRG